MTDPRQIFLTPDEIQQLTGYVVPAYQCRWLTSHRWRFERAVNGRAIVLRQHAEEMLSHAKEAPAPVAWEPNIAAMRKRA